MRKTVSFIFVSLTSLAAVVVAAALFAIVFFIFSESVPAIKEVGLRLFSPNWYPVWEVEPEFGIGTMLLNSLILSVWTSVWVWTIGLGVAIYLHKYALNKERELILRVLEYVSGIPSVVLGLFGVLILGNWFLRLGAWSAQNFLNASIVLSVLTLPFMVSLTFQSLEKVPRQLTEGAIALGAKDLAVTWIELKHAAAGIVNAMLTVFNRIFGETMIVLMVAGGANMLLKSLLDPVRPLTATLGSEIGEVAVGSLHYSVLFFIAFLVLTGCLILNVLSNMITRKLERWIKG
ncbi:MAG: ABC transporter permease subunit [Pseudothermotoga sp.]|uniref:PstC family ABC transporter permease n=1 Tax=Pseudothermotoga sp. TaxID=2033661 RepID=UPI0019A71AAA|nr:ABC transporter permease subunit [Pseudothermotoga sp.]MBC7123593.1 ABC transporter permease subunit [Pseudothermotoga sp.]MDI6862164.1 ABC transporter permease subunit [Pseudothermotoga sp.]